NYYADGKIKTKEQIASNGIDAEVQTFSEQGHLITEKRFRNTKLHGLSVSYYEGTKVPHIKETYTDGKLSGIRYTYYPSGKIKQEESVAFNLLVVPFKTYYENGNAETIYQYRSNRKHGLFTSFHENGKTKEQGNYVADKKHGSWKTYSTEGKLIKTTTYKA